MSRAALRYCCLTVLLCVAGAAHAGIQSRISIDEFAGLTAPREPGARVTLERLTVGESVQTLDLERFEVWAPDAEIIEEGEGGVRKRLSPPAVQYYRGTVRNDPDSVVFVSVGADQRIDGFILSGDRRHVLSSRPERARGGKRADVLIEEADDYETNADAQFRCALDGLPTGPPVGLPRVRSQGEGIASQGTLSGTGTWTLNIAVETDNELYVDLGSSSSNVTTFIGNVVAAASIFYERDLRTNLVITFTRVQTSAADPWDIVPGDAGTWNGNPTPLGGFTSSHALAELGDEWHFSAPFAGPRSSVVLMSGKNQTAGVAWTSRSCTADFLCSGNCGQALFDGHYGGGYAFVGLGTPSTSVPDPNNTTNGVQYGLPNANYWPVLGFAHELGHNVGGPHTHCVALSVPEQTLYGVVGRSHVDLCENFESANPACYGGAESVPAEKGTIMSYCHLKNTGSPSFFPQSRFLFGRNTEPSQKIVDLITTYVDSRTPASPAISAPPSLAIGFSSNASIVSPPVGLTYVWTITNGTINGSSTATTINFTATGNPVTLRVRGTNTSGCSATDFVNVTGISCSNPAISQQPSSVAITATTSTTLSVTASSADAITYQWYIGASGNTSTPTGTNSSSLLVTPASTTSYWVRLTNSCGSTDSATATVTVVPASSTNTSFYTVTPCRIIDTRNAIGPAGGPPPGNNAIRLVQVSGTCGVPVTANAISINVTAVTPPTAGWLTLYAADAALPFASTINYRSGQTRANNAVVTLSPAGQMNVYNFNGVGATHFIIDVNGYFD